VDKAVGLDGEPRIIITLNGKFLAYTEQKVGGCVGATRAKVLRRCLPCRLVARRFLCLAPHATLRAVDPRLCEYPLGWAEGTFQQPSTQPSLLTPLIPAPLALHGNAPGGGQHCAAQGLSRRSAGVVADESSSR
jgi:hypothetical protein